MRIGPLTLFALLFTACTSNKGADSGEPTDTAEDVTVENDAPVVTADSTYTVLFEEDVEYAQGLAHDETSTTPFAIPLYLDVYSPDNNSTNRPVFMFIHGGGFTGGVKDGPEMIAMANYYASRGWVFLSIDYRTTEELCNAKELQTCRQKVGAMIQNDLQNGTDEIETFYRGIAPTEWIDHALPLIETPKELQVSIASYAAQRDAKAALRWIVANSSTYNINTDFITVGGNSAGSATTVTLGISNLDDFRDEIDISDDPTLSTTNLDQTYSVKSMVHLWGNTGVLDFHEGVYNLDQYDRFDVNDPELFMGHGEAEDLQSPYEEALELQDIYDSLGIYSELKTLLVPDENEPTDLLPAGHGAWNGEVDGKSLFEMSYEFIVARQGLNVE